MHEFLKKNKLRILLLPFFTVFPILGIAILWNSFIPRSVENVKVDANVVQAKSGPSNDSKSQSELEKKKQELERLTNETNELDAILKEKEEIYQRIKLLQEVGGYDMEIQEAQDRNEELNNTLMSKYSELWDEK